MSFPIVTMKELGEVNGSTLGPLPSGYSNEVRSTLATFESKWIDQNLAPYLDDTQIASFKARLDAMKKDMALKPAVAMPPKGYMEQSLG
jgi:hypothetical protein